jgi:hypothetical protein
MRYALAAACVLFTTAGEVRAGSDATSAILAEMQCKRAPKAGPVLAQLYRDRLISRNPSKVFDSINVFPLREPVTIDGLQIVAVFGYDERSDFPFVRAPGTSPGNVFGVVTRSPLYSVDQWRAKVSPDITLDDGNTGISGAKELSCTK